MESFSHRVWELATSIPEGKVVSYGMLARAAGGGPQSARSITSILTKAPNKKAIPFHRIIYADGRAWFSSTGEQARRKLYAREGIIVNERGYIANLEEVLYYFD